MSTSSESKLAENSQVYCCHQVT